MNTMNSLKGRVDAIVIGASAGGVDALSQLMPALPAELKAPIFIVVHLPRERPSLLVDIFSAKCALPIREAEDKDPIQTGTVYFAPPDYHLLIDDGPQIALSADDPVNFSRPSVDVLFDSAADIYGDRLLGIILTGANHDGAEGMHAIHSAGGITIVQQPSDAQSPQMPRFALAQTDADYVLPLDQIVALLQTLENGGSA